MKTRAFLMMALLCTIVQGTWAWDGSGTSADPYKIKSSADWKQLADDVNGGNSYSGKFFEMTADIDAQGISVGSEVKPFSGTFSGGMHTLTYDRGGAMPDRFEYVDDYCAPFVRLEGATIRHLKVKGSIFSRHKFAAGIASLIDGSRTTTIDDCHVSSRLFADSNLKDDATFGGLVGVVEGTCTASPVIKNCSFMGGFSGWATRSSGLVGYTNLPIAFEHCMMDPKETSYYEGCATFARMVAGVTCTFEECYYTQLMGEEQGVAVFREVLVSDGCKAEIVSEPTINFDGEKYWQNGAVVKLTIADDADFNHWETNGTCYINDPWQRNGTHVIGDLSRKPIFSPLNEMVKPSDEREMDGIKYRYLSRRDYHLYLSDEVCRQKGYQFDKNDDLFKWDAKGNKAWVTAIVGWVPGNIPTGGAVIYSDLTGAGRDHTLLGCIAPHAFQGCTELKTLYFKDTGANTKDASFQFDFQIGDYAFAYCGNLTEIKMMQYTTDGDNHWEALRPDQVSAVGSNVFYNSPKAMFSTDASQYQNYLSSKTWKDYQRRITVYNHTDVDMTVNGARYSEMRNTAGESLKNDADGHAQLMETLRLWNADYQQFSANSLLTNSSENIWYTTVVGCDDDYLKSNDGVLRIYNDPGSYYNYKTIAIGRNAFKDSQELRAIEFWQTNGRSENSYSDLKMVIQNGAFYGCTNLKELRMYYYVQDGDDHWEVLGPKDVIPGDNIFGLPSKAQMEQMTQEEFLAWPRVNKDFHIVVSPEMYNDFINDPNWVKYYEYIVAADYEPSNWNPVETEGLSYAYAAKTANTASTDQVVTQNLSWWNVPIKIYEAITIYKMLETLASANIPTVWKKFVETMKEVSVNTAKSKEAFASEMVETNLLASQDPEVYTRAIDYHLKNEANNLFVQESVYGKEAFQKGLLYLNDNRYYWTPNVREMLLNSQNLRTLLKNGATECHKHFISGQFGTLINYYISEFHRTTNRQLANIFAIMNQTGFYGGAYSALMAMGDDMTEEEFQRGLTENIKANIHNVSYDNMLVYTPDKKLIYHVCVDKPAKDQKKYTIYQDIGNVYNYRTVAIRKNAFQGNKTLEEIDFAESPYTGRTNYVPMQMAIPDSAFVGCSNLKRFSLIYRTQLRSEARDENDYRALGPENFILGGDHIFDGCDSTKLQIIIPEDRKEDFLRDENWSKFQKYFVYQTVQEYAMYSEYGVNYAIHYENNTSWKQTRVNGHTIDHLTAISADNEFLDGHQGSMGLFNDIGSYNNYKLDMVKRKAFAGNDHLKTVSFWDLNGGDSYTTLDMTLGDSCFINCRNLKNIDMLYCVTDGTDHIEPLKPSQVRAGKGMFDGSPDCIIKMLPQQQAWFEADTAWVKYKDRFRACIIQPGDEGVVKALKGYRYYTPCCDPYYWDGYIDLARIGGANYEGMKEALQDQKENIRSFAEFKQFEVIGLDYVGQEWFRGCKNLSNILLPSTIKTIQPFAFANCYKLEEIELPAAVSEIGDEAFNDCPVLKIIHVRSTTPAKLTGKTQFSRNDGLKIYVPDAAVDAYRTAWPEYKDYIVTDGAYMLKKEVTVSKPNQLADKLGLYVEISYSGLFFGDEPRYVHGPYAKYDSLTISGPLGNLDLAVIRYLAGCDAYTSGGKATDGQLRYLNLYNATIKKTDDGYNYFNDDLTVDGTRYSIVSDNELPDYLFYNCTALETVILPKSLKEIGTRIFAGCSSLKQLAVTGSIDDYESWTGKAGLLDYPLETLVFATDKPAQSSRKDPWGKPIDNVYAKKSQLGEYMGQNYLTVQARNITAPIEDDAVVDALAEEGMFFPAEYLNMKKLGRTFVGNDKITRFKDFSLFHNIKSLDNDDFLNCYNMRVISLPDSVQFIRRAAFNVCNSLDSIYISTDQVPELDDNAFMSLPHDFRIFVPKQLCKLYREKWAQYADHINVDEDFYQKSPIKTVTVTAPNTLAVALGLQPEISKTGTILTKHLHGMKGNYSGITHLKVVGPISATDFDVLKYLAGYCPWKQCRNYAGHLEYLDLYDAQIVESDGYSYLAQHTVVGGAISHGVDADVLPTYALQNAYSLKTLILPRTCKKVRTRAMIGCEDMESLVIGDDMEDFNWDALDDGASLTRMYILAKQKVYISEEFPVWRWLCNNYNPTFDAFYVRPSLYNDYIADDDYTGSSWQRTNNISRGAFDDDESFCAFAAHAAATKDDLAMVTSVDGWFDKHSGVKDLSLLGYTAIDSLSKATLTPLTQLQQIVMPVTLTGMEEGLFENAKNLRSADFLLCDSTDVVASLRNGGLAKLGINTQQTLAYVPATYGPTTETNVITATALSGSPAETTSLHAAAFRMIDTLDYCVPYAFEADKVENTRPLAASAVPYTVCVPYKMKVPAYSRAYKLSDRDANSLVFTEVTGELEAMHPYLVKVVGNKRFRKMSTTLDTDIRQTIPASDVNTYGRQDDGSGYSVRGTFDAISNKTAADLGAYILQDDGNWHPVVSGFPADKPASILPFRAYLLPSTRIAGARISMSLVDDATGIDSIETIDEDGTRRYYDLNGHELQGKPVKGVYIYKGKKRVIK